MSVKPIPEGYQQVIPYLIVSDAAQQMEFLINALGGVEKERMTLPDGSVMHGQVQVGDSMIMIGQSKEEYPSMPSMLYVYVEDCDSVYQQALSAGAESISECEDQVYGDRHGAVKDSNGNHWCIATHIEDVSGDEIMERFRNMKG